MPTSTAGHDLLVEANSRSHHPHIPANVEYFET